MRANPVVAALSIASLVFATPTLAFASPPVEGPVEGPAEAPLPSIDEEPGSEPLPDLEPEPSEPQPTIDPEPTPSDAAPIDASPIDPPPPTMQQPTVVRVAVGLSSELDGNKAERAMLDRLESGMKASTSPRANVRRLRVGSAEPREICREGRDDLVIDIAYLPDRDDPVLLTRDCRIDQDLGIRSVDAAGDPALLGVLWAEHNTLVSSGARERKRLRISPGVRTGLIAGSVILVVGIAAGLLIAGAVRRDTVVLVIEPQ